MLTVDQLVEMLQLPSNHGDDDVAGRRQLDDWLAAPPDKVLAASTSRRYCQIARTRSPVRSSRASPNGQAPSLVMWTLRNTMG
jgi:hypothetical protein